MRRRDAGFTLIEMLVTVVVLGLLAASLLQGTRLGVAAWDGAERRQREMMAAEAAERLLRDVIARMLPQGGATPPLIGTPGTMAFRASPIGAGNQDAAKAPQAAAPTAAPAIAIGLGLDAAQRLVLRELPPEPPPGQPRGGVRETVLLEGVERMAFAYWQGDAWQTEWRRDGLPRLVRVQYQLAGRNRRQWPPIVIGIPGDGAAP